MLLKLGMGNLVLDRISELDSQFLHEQLPLYSGLWRITMRNYRLGGRRIETPPMPSILGYAENQFNNPKTALKTNLRTKLYCMVMFYE